MAARLEDLASTVRNEKVVPVVGRELLRVPTGDGKTELLETSLARELAGKLGLDPGTFEASPTFSEVHSEFLMRKGSREKDLYMRLNDLWIARREPVPPVLQRLASIRAFRTFVTTTFDDLLVRALNDVRFGGEAKTVVKPFIANSKEEKELYVGDDESAALPRVYQIFGRISSVMTDYAVTDEDALEWVYMMLERKHRLTRLLSELRESNLLILGGGLPDWIARLLLRLLRNERWRKERDHGIGELIADPSTGRQGELTVFLRRHKVVIYEEPVEEVIAYLANACGDASPVVPRSKEDPKEVVFLSYAHEDHVLAQKIKEQLEEQQIPVWLDKDRLKAGVQYTPDITRRIQQCVVFVPLLTEHTQSDELTRFFRQEWTDAQVSSKGRLPGARFVRPICASASQNESNSRFAEFFTGLHWTYLNEHGGLPGSFLEDLLLDVRAAVARKKGFEAA